MSLPAKSQINDWIETIRKQVEQADQPPQANRSNAQRGKRQRATDNSLAREALRQLQALGENLTARATELQRCEIDILERSQRLAAAATQFEEQSQNSTQSTPTSAADEIYPPLSLPFAEQVADRVAEQVTTQLTAQLTAQLTLLIEAQLATVCEAAAALPVKLPVELFTESASDWSVAQNEDARTSSEPTLIAELEAEIASLRNSLAAVTSESRQVDDAEALEQRAALAEDTLLAELADLRQQNSDLATQLARLQMSGYHNAPHLNLTSLSQESMTWEQRKRLIMQQLENETAVENSTASSQHRLEVEEILRATQAEIERRDEEIVELKSIVELQSNTREGVAIGAAAIAQMLDSDELVKLEREKLVSIQQEWEGKLREAEIQMSMERAKLSRERAELEEQLRRQVSAEAHPPTVAKLSSDGKPVRKWLEHLGLRDK